MGSSPQVAHAVRPVLAALARGALGDAFHGDVPVRMLETLELLASEADRDQVLRVFGALGTRSGALALTGRAVPVSWLTATEAEALLQRWRASRVPTLRRFAGIAISLAMSGIYGHPGEQWLRMGYQGPLGPPPESPKRLAPLEVHTDEVLDCDIAVVGSGAGGGCVAAGLAAQGFDVIVLEKGGYHSESDFTHVEPQAARDMYLYGMTLATSDLGCRILAGSTLGGGTVVNYSTSFRTPDFVLREWAELTGIDAFVSGEFDESLDAASERLGVNTDSSAAGRRDVVMEEGLKAMGWHVDLLPRAVRACTQDEACGYCGFGCRIGAKQSTMRTYLEDAAEAGARMVVGANVRRVVIEDGRARGVEAAAGGHRLRVNSNAVVVAAGAIESPAILLRSGLGGRVGHNLRLHPGTAALGFFEDEVRLWEGTLQARYSKEFRHWDGGYGPIFETVPVHPRSAAMSLPWLSTAQHRALMDRFAHVGMCAVLPRDRTAGRVRVARDGSVRVDYHLDAGDERRLADGVVAAGLVMEAAGAEEVFSLHSNLISYVPGRSGAHQLWAEETRAAGYGKGKAVLASYHQMGTCSMGTSPDASVVDSNNETHEVNNLFVADSSNFPTASGVNPMLTVYGFAHRAAGRIGARLS